MSNITLIMTRTPLEEVDYGKKNGRWGRMIVVKGAKVTSGTFTGIPNLPDIFSFGIFESIETHAYLATAAWKAVFGKPTYRMGYKAITLNTVGGDVELVAAFDTLERFRGEKDRSAYFVQLPPNPSTPYQIKMDISRNVRGYTDKEGKKHEGVNETGQCFRVLNPGIKCKTGGDAGILIHEASHPGWLLGCIAPREMNNRVAGSSFTSSKNAMKKLFSLMGGFSEGKKVDLLVMDW
jgi:hypothetical protein